MTDKVQKIKEWIQIRKLSTMDEHMKFYCKEAESDYNILCSIEKVLDSQQEVPVSEDLGKCTSKIILEGTNFNKSWYAHPELAFKAGVKWKKENLWKSADGDDLPEYDREVIAILDYDFGHYKVVYAHRPNPNGWNGTNIDTEEKEHFEPVIYDKGGWNQPHILYWLDAELPYEENKITK